MAEPETRYDRQAAILPPDRMALFPVTIIGVGAIGRQVALQLAAAGVPNIRLVDFDTVEVPNLGPQGFRERDVGRPKVDAVRDAMLEMFSAGNFTVSNARFKASDTVTPVVFCCVDRIDTRQWLWETIQEAVQLFVDGRMAAEVIRIVTSCDSEGVTYYPTTLFAQGEAFQGACTARSTIFTANVAAGLMVEQYAKWLREMPLDKDIVLNLLAMDMTAS